VIPDGAVVSFKSGKISQAEDQTARPRELRSQSTRLRLGLSVRYRSEHGRLPVASGSGIFYPEDFSRRQHIFRNWRSRPPALVSRNTMRRSLSRSNSTRPVRGRDRGPALQFHDKGGREVSLRPEMTPTVWPAMVGEKGRTP